MDYTVKVVKVTPAVNPNAKEIKMKSKIIEAKASSSTIKQTRITPVKVDGTIVKEVVHSYLYAGNHKPFLILKERNDGTGSCEVLFSR